VAPTASSTVASQVLDPKVRQHAGHAATHAAVRYYRGDPDRRPLAGINVAFAFSGHRHHIRPRHQRRINTPCGKDLRVPGPGRGSRAIRLTSTLHRGASWHNYY
jgi:hypothetical protein